MTARRTFLFSEGQINLTARSSKATLLRAGTGGKMLSTITKIKWAGLLAVLLLGGVVYSDMPLPVSAANPEPRRITEPNAIVCVSAMPECPETDTDQRVQDYIPLDPDVQIALFSVCDKAGVDYNIALGLIQVESRFVPDAVNDKNGCYGLCQLNPEYFPVGLPPVENVECGIMFLGDQIERYDNDLAAALTAYNAGHDTGRRDFAEAVFAAAEDWAEVLGWKS